MVIKIFHPELQGQQTRLSSAILASAVTSLVDNNSDFATNDLLLFGAYGQEKTEIKKVTSVSGANTVNHIATLFPHAEQTPVSKIKYDKVEISRASSENGTYAVLATVDITPDEDRTYYDDPTGTSTSFYKTRYYNSITALYSQYSDPVQGTGYTSDSLFDMTEEVLEEFGDANAREINRPRVHRLLRAGVRKVMIKLIQMFPDYRREYTTQDLTANTATYDYPERFLSFFRVDVNFGSTTYENAMKVEKFESEAEGFPSTIYDQSDPRVFLRATQWGLRPTPTSSSGRAFLWFWAYPEEMRDDTDEHGLPYGARDALVAYALYRLWLPKNKDRADLHKGLMRESMQDVSDFMGQARQSVTNKSVEVVMGDDLYDDD